MQKQRNKATKSNIKLIAGTWRGRKINFVEKNNLRPTKGIIKETLFNLLRNYIEGSVCLDMFAGSGSLGFEAASRGAKYVYMLENDKETIDCLIDQKNALSAKNINIIYADANSFENHVQDMVDIIFLDPPFSENLLQNMIDKISSSTILKDKCKIYVEIPFTKDFLKDYKIPANWTLQRKGKSGDVSYLLLQHNMI